MWHMIDMTVSQAQAWFAGLFEGEGTFAFNSGKPRALALTSTDRDVIDVIVKYFGGYVHEVKSRKPHHKQAWLWQARSSEAIGIAEQLEPFLLGRRAERCRQFIAEYRTLEQYQAGRVELREQRRLQAHKLYAQGLLQREIAATLGVTRSRVSQLLHTG